MLSFSGVDIFIIILFFAAVVVIGFVTGKKSSNNADDYLLSGRKVGLFLFILTNVSTWYGGILGVGEFTYRYGIVSWFTQGLPYYIFAFLFAIFFAGKIRRASLFTIPDKLSEVYGNTAGLIAAVLVFILVSPAPYLLMTANLLTLFFDVGIIAALIISLLISISYLLYGGFRSNVYTDAFQFFVMFGGFIVLVVILIISNGFEMLQNNLPPAHLKLTGEATPAFILVWFLIALWTFADPGFHQRCYAAKDENTAVKGIIYSIFFWALFDFLTTTSGLFARAMLPNIETPVLAYPLLAEIVLIPGIRGIFYAALFATIMSTLNSFLFLSGTTIGRDFIYRLKKQKSENSLKKYTVIGLIISGILSIILAYKIPSVIEIWYTIGSFCIPGIILPVISAYYEKIRIDRKIIIAEILTASLLSITWFFIKAKINGGQTIQQIEPMLVGFAAALIIHSTGLFIKSSSLKQR